MNFDDVLDAFRADPKLARIAADYEASKKKPARKFGSNALKVKGKIFAMMSSRGEFVVKLPAARAAELVAARAAKFFKSGGRTMKEWAVITSGSWIDLAREAHAYVKKA